MQPYKIVTINILNDMKGWPQRRGLLLEGLAHLDADIIALQEVNVRHNNAAWLAQELGGYQVYLCPKTGPLRTFEGIALLSRLPVREHAHLDLGSQQRVAQWIQIETGGRPLIVANGHFFWFPGDPPQRRQQIERLVAWLAKIPGDPAIAVCGDFNGTPESKAIQLMQQHFESAHARYHGIEPAYTCPTPLARGGFVRSLALQVLNMPVRRQKLWRGTLDYIFINQHIQVAACQVVLDQPAPHDAKLYPSDHFGLSATLQIVPLSQGGLTS